MLLPKINTLMIFTCNYVALQNVQYSSLVIVMTETGPQQTDVCILFPYRVLLTGA